MELQGKRVLVMVDQAYQEMEVWVPLYRLREAGAEVITVGATAGASYPSKLGYPCVATKSYQEVKADGYDGIVVPVVNLSDLVCFDLTLGRPAGSLGMRDSVVLALNQRQSNQCQNRVCLRGNLLTPSPYRKPVGF